MLWFVVAAFLSVVASAGLAGAADRIFVTTSSGVVGNCAVVDVSPPWNVTANLEPVGPFATLRVFGGLLWAVNGAPFFAGGATHDVQAIDPVTFDTVRRFSTGSGSNPRDIAFVDPAHAWVSLYDSRWLLEIDPTTGAPLDSVDLGGFADADGLPEMAWMAIDGTHLFVQIQRIDRPGSGATVSPAMLAVVDVATKQLIDVDPVRSGVQAIELLGPEPQTKMQVEGRRLYVSTPGKFLDIRGGIEVIHLDTFQHLGFLISEKDWSIDMGAFILVSPTRGYVINHTDFALSSHLDSFERPSGSFIVEHFVSFSMIESVEHDPLTDQLFFPDPDAGIRIFRSSDGDTLGGPIATGLAPRDLVLLRSGPTGVPPVPAALTFSVAPNPFHDETRIALNGITDRPVTVTIHDVRGRLVRRVQREADGAGNASFVWDGRDEGGSEVPAGVYLVGVRSGASGPMTSRRVARVQ